MKFTRSLWIHFLGCTLLAAPLSVAQQSDWSPYYSFEKVALPKTVDHQVGGLTTLSDGRIAACFDSGEVLFYEPETGTWSEFARGLMSPLGLLEEPSGSLLVMQWAELTRLTDTNSDGKADFYETVCDDFGISGNYHEFAYGPARDKDGNLYIALNVASNNGGVFEHVRGPWSPIGLAKEHMDASNGKKITDKYKKDAGRMFSRVPLRGWVLKITPEGKMEPFASGFRSPDGIGFDDEGRLWVTDNQGDWKATNPLYHVEQGNFYGHPASLIWQDGWDGRNPLDVPVEELETMRTREAALIPYGDMANSLTQPIPTIDPELFGLPRGELLIGDMNQPNLIRFLSEEVGGTVQGAAIPFLFTTRLGIGNHRFTFGKDGALWIGKTHLKWAGDEGLLKVTWNQKPMFLVEKVQLLENGFEIHFNKPLSTDAPAWKISRHTYHYHADYGSPRVDLQKVEPSEISVSEDRRSVRLVLPEIKTNYLYSITADHATSADKEALMGHVMHYFVNKAATAEAEFEDLLGSGDLSKFSTGAQGKSWTLKDGVLSRGAKKVGSLRTKQKYKNFELKFDWKISAGGNSGVIYRSQKGKGLEYQVLDDAGHIRGKTPATSASALYDLAEPSAEKNCHPAGEWNSARIVSNGNHIEHWLNGTKVLEIEIGSDEWKRSFTKSKFKDLENFAETESPIEFQDHGADVFYRNILIRDL
ncbi:family 16 glycoside hydrolase [Luteolibacter algae]|uniref:Family 16 glycoside hydrolase n=1 Tax=Luteolibacter algae TaxID=454151 RepID=A0ABW5D569_9BACT